MNSRAIVGGAVLVLLLCLSAGGGVADDAQSIQNIDEYLGGMAFLLDGEICLAKLDGTEIQSLTHTDGKVRDFRFSPDLKYLAYKKAVGMVEDIGYREEGEEVPRVETWSIVIVKLATMEPAFEIQPEDGWLEFGKWAGNKRLLYYSSSGYDIAGYYQYDVAENTAERLESRRGWELLRTVFSADGSLMAYVDHDGSPDEDYRVCLHIATEGTNDDSVVLRDRFVNSPQFSHDLKSVAYWVYEKLDGQRVSTVKRYIAGCDSPQQLAVLPSHLSGGNSIAWSVTDSCIGLFYYPSEYPNGYVVALSDPTDVHVLSGKEFCWAGDDAVLYSRGASELYIYHMKDRKETLLIENATHPHYLIAAD